jgi:hypothetical protein
VPLLSGAAIYLVNIRAVVGVCNGVACWPSFRPQNEERADFVALLECSSCDAVANAHIPPAVIPIAER